MDDSYSILIEKAITPEKRPPLARAIIEFVASDLDRPPIVFLAARSDELDKAIEEAILRRWARR